MPLLQLEAGGCGDHVVPLSTGHGLTVSAQGNGREAPDRSPDQIKEIRACTGLRMPIRIPRRPDLLDSVRPAADGEPADPGPVEPARLNLGCPRLDTPERPNKLESAGLKNPPQASSRGPERFPSATIRRIDTWHAQ
ncbi:hypothetical protein GCM10025866_12250 [Naasia aerilata]|uniref:Uncharacterized protein n=1 Tax=Naasia aerilata TaxID=1162966 RepID=A0ABN6XNS4_9MICO|nr:hypothetical protein GCM10025866_12250 [Naasia aerilata]